MNLLTVEDSVPGAGSLFSFVPMKGYKSGHLIFITVKTRKGCYSKKDRKYKGKTPSFDAISFLWHHGHCYEDIVIFI